MPTYKLSNNEIYGSLVLLNEFNDRSDIPTGLGFKTARLARSLRGVARDVESTKQRINAQYPDDADKRGIELGLLGELVTEFSSVELTEEDFAGMKAKPALLDALHWAIYGETP